MKRIAVLCVFLFLPYPGKAQKSTPPIPPAQVAQEVRAWRMDNEDRILRELTEFLSLANAGLDTSGTQRNAERLAEMLEARGIETHLFPVAGHGPIVFGKLTTPEAARTVIFFAHYDGPPVDAAAWGAGKPLAPALFTAAIEEGGKRMPLPESGPGKLAVYHDDWRIYARSSSEGKSPIVALLSALDALRARNIPLAVNVKVIFEGEEKAGSPDLQRTLDLHRNLLEGDVLILLGGHLDSSGQPVVTLASGDSHLSEKIVQDVEGAAGPALKIPLDSESVPVRVFKDLGLPITGVPIANHDNHRGSAEENIRLGNLWRGLEIYAALLAGLNW